jgi:hypothetical protein
MNKDSANILILVGLLVTFGGVGGIENSMNDTDLMGAMVVSIVGMLIMYCGLLATKVLDSYRD